jgi:hypothetical protein
MARSWREANGFEAVGHDLPLPGPNDLHVIADSHGDPLTIFSEGLALARRAGMSWWQALTVAWAAALSVESDKQEREQWAVALDATLSAWRSAYERRHTNCAL